MPTTHTTYVTLRRCVWAFFCTHNAYVSATAATVYCNTERCVSLTPWHCPTHNPAAGVSSSGTLGFVWLTAFKSISVRTCCAVMLLLAAMYCCVLLLLLCINHCNLDQCHMQLGSVSAMRWLSCMRDVWCGLCVRTVYVSLLECHMQIVSVMLWFSCMCEVRRSVACCCPAPAGVFAMVWRCWCNSQPAFLCGIVPYALVLQQPAFCVQTWLCSSSKLGCTGCSDAPSWLA
jgi:hypothetical protein